MENNVPFQGFNGLNGYLDSLTKSIQIEHGLLQHSIQYLSKDVLKVIASENMVLDDADRAFLHQVFAHALQSEAQDPLEDPDETLTSEDMRLCFYIFRDAMVEAIKTMRASTRVTEIDFKESLSAMLNLTEHGRCTKDEKLPILRFITFTTRELAQRLNLFET